MIKNLLPGLVIFSSDFIIKTSFQKDKFIRTQLVIEGEKLYNLIKDYDPEAFEPQYQNQIRLFKERMAARTPYGEVE